MNNRTNAASHAVGILQNVGLPKPKDFPAKLPQGAALSGVALNIVGDLRYPIAGISPVRKLSPEFTPFPTVPEVPIAKDSNSSTTEHKVRSSWESGHVPLPAESQSLQLLFNETFWPGPCGSVALHRMRAGL